MIRVTPADLAAVSPALDRHARGPIFLQANLLRHGLAGTAPRAVHLWRNAGMTAFLGLTVAGVLLPQMRDASPADWASLPDILSGHTVAGLNGDLPQVTGCLANLSLPTARVDRAEPCFALTLTDLRMPDCAGLVLSPPRPQDLPSLIEWRSAYRQEAMAEPPDTACAAAQDELPLWLQDDALRLLWCDDRPVAMTGLNARHGDVVQVGGVFTPRPLRGRGYARAAVAMHLAQVARQGARRAFLFAASDAAAVAYRAIGFTPDGQMRMVMLPQAIRISA